MTLANCRVGLRVRATTVMIATNGETVGVGCCGFVQETDNKVVKENTSLVAVKWEIEPPNNNYWGHTTLDFIVLNKH